MQWVDRYIPTTLDEYVWRDDKQRATVEKWLAEGEMPHVLFSGVPGVGKTSLVRLILSLMGIPDEDILTLNASKHRLVDDVQARLGDFVSTMAFNHTGIKYVILNEADKLSDTTQGMLRDEFEQYSEVCRFAMTCNRVDKISAALKSRCQGFHFTELERGQYVERLVSILASEGVRFNDETLGGYISSCYPDLRKCIGLMQQYSTNGELLPLPEEESIGLNFLAEAIDRMTQGKITEGRRIIVEHARPDDYPDIYRFFYENLELFGKTEYEQGTALLVIRDAIVNHEIVADKEINLAAAICELFRIET